MYSLAQAMRAIRGNWVASVSTITTMTLSLTMLAALSLLSVNLNQALATLQSELEVAAYLERGARVRGQQPYRSGVVQGQVLDDDAGLRHHLSVIDQQRHLAERPQCEPGRSLVRVTWIQQTPIRLDTELVERDQDFVAVRRQRVEVQYKLRHRSAGSIRSASTVLAPSTQASSRLNLGGGNRAAALAREAWQASRCCTALPRR